MYYKQRFAAKNRPDFLNPIWRTVEKINRASKNPVHAQVVTAPLNKNEKKKKYQRNDVITALTPIRRRCFAKFALAGEWPSLFQGIISKFQTHVNNNS